MKFLFSILKNRWWVLGLALLMLSTAYYIDKYRQREENDYIQITTTLQEQLQKREKSIEKILGNDSLLFSFIHGGFNLEKKPNLDKKNLILLAFKDTLPIFWSSNVADPGMVIHDSSTEIEVIGTQNGWYLYKKRKIKEYTFAVLYHFYTHYPYQNRYLKNKFADDANISNTAEISKVYKDKYVPVRSIYGKKLCYVSLHTNHHNPLTAPVVVLGIFGLWLFFIFLSNQYEWFLERGKTIAGTLFFALVLLLLKLLVIDLKFPSLLQSSQLFSPALYASSGLFSSLGSLLVNVVLLFIFVFTLSKQNTVNETTEVPSFDPNNHKKNALLFIPAIFVLIIFTGFIISILRSLILDSKIPFDISNIFHFTWFSFVGLLITALLVSIHFFATNLVFQFLLKAKLSNKWFLIYALAAAILYLAYLFIRQNFLLSLAIQAPAYGIALLLVLQLSAGLKTPQRTLAYVMAVSVFVALLFYRFNIDKEHEIRKLYAIQLGDSKDIEAENSLADIEVQIANDPRIFNYFINGIFSKRDLEKHIKQLYFSGYLSKYDVEIFDYDTAGNFFRENNYYPYDFINTLYNDFSQRTLSNYFSYILYPSAQYIYIAKYDYCYGIKTLGHLYILLKRKLVQDKSLFTELLSQRTFDSELPSYNYSYAIYQNGKLVNKAGKYNYGLDFIFDTTGSRPLIKTNGYSHYIQAESNNIVIVVSKKSDGILQPLAVFSFLFLMLLLFIALLFLYNALILMLRAAFAYYTGKWKPLYRLQKFIYWLVPIKGMRSLLFSTRIQVTMFTLVSAILLLSGYIFLSYIDFKYTERQRDKMMHKITQVSGAFKDQAQFEIQLMLPTELTAYLNQIGDFYESDINFFNAEGELKASTKNKIYTSGLVSRQINPLAFRRLQVEKQSFFLQEEKIGGLKYVSAYVPVLDSKQAVLAYINLPFFTNEEELNEEISAFFVNFVNLYILFFLLSAVIAYIITQRVTAPLILIQSQLSKVNLREKNEIIEWKDDDEIGELVAQYNKVILALEDSANKLAESEREGAWREMAKQIAHEIKNPLTPMKLSIQHLQRAWADKGEKLEDTFKRVTHVLIEQIDSLSNLASEFSNFAKMPEPVAELLDINHQIKLVTALYENTESLTITRQLLPETTYVLADKDQLSRVFTNIITNAIQAIPEDRQGEINISLTTKKDWVIIAIKDNGKGITKAEGNKVFLPSFSTKNSGMGLGLAISKKIIESFKGNIYFESEVGVGTIFYIELLVEKTGEK